MTAKVFLSLSNKALVLITMCLLLGNTYAMERSSNGKHLAQKDEEVTVLTRYEVKKAIKRSFANCFASMWDRLLPIKATSWQRPIMNRKTLPYYGS